MGSHVVHTDLKLMSRWRLPSTSDLLPLLQAVILQVCTTVSSLHVLGILLRASCQKALYQMVYILKPSHLFTIKSNKQRLTSTAYLYVLTMFTRLYTTMSTISRIMIHTQIFTALTIIKEKVKRTLWVTSNTSLKILLRLTSCITIMCMLLENISSDFNAFQKSSD